MEEGPAKYQGKYVPAELILPNQRERGAISVHAVSNAGAHLTSLSVKIVEVLERLCPGVLLRTPCPLGARHAVNVAGEPVSVTECTVPLQLTFITSWGPATLPPISCTIMDGSDGAIRLEWPTPARQLGDPMKTWMSPPGPSVGTSVLGCRRVS